MKTIGLIGGMSWESTVTYYQIVNEVVKQELGGLHSAKVILYSVEFDEIEKCQAAGEWEKSGEILGRAAQGLEAAGADFILICTNTMHKVFDQVQSFVKVPLLHIAQVTADALKRAGISRVGLLGTKYTMEQDFYKGRLAENGIDVIIPEKEEIDVVNAIIFNELCLGEIKDASRKTYLKIIDEMTAKGAQGIILGCTEIGLLVHQADTTARLFDTTQIHGETAALMSLGKL
ncbi:aspartate/glutamate racemase family protein [uncultured Dysosmobacter sp.]|uniref:aspartate/glutamate racemase family protein n=1 Tax=uncultured Dysosmobacter sp. TaxID=2591384 RepID=UPI002632AF4B|nr:aspartate/glutamate racemase family protein [uncultured Dysosmobacter sp.]